MIKTSFLLVLALLVQFVYAGKISGTVTSDKGEILAFSSINVKGQQQGTSANNHGSYFLQLDPGVYTIICRHVGYEKIEKPSR